MFTMVYGFMVYGFMVIFHGDFVVSNAKIRNRSEKARKIWLNHHPNGKILRFSPFENEGKLSKLIFIAYFCI